MSYTIYLRPLVIEDALVSYKWRNNPQIWLLTGARPDREITTEIETAWLKKALERINEKRFAICLTETDEYIGNAQLTDIQEEQAQYHIFIGEQQLWGKGIAKQVTSLILGYSFNDLNLKNIYLEVHELNLPAIAVYKKAGFTDLGISKNHFIRMGIKNSLTNLA